MSAESFIVAVGFCAVEVAVKPFHERVLAQVIEQELPDVVRYAETVFIQRRVYSPGWFARKLL